MERAEQRQRGHRSARLPISPKSDLIQAALLLGFSFGMALAGVQEAALDHQWIWMAGFIAGAAWMAGLYWWVALTWIRLVI